MSSTPEQEWDEQQQAWMLALAECEAMSCHGCGGWLPETTAIENDERYAAPEGIRCHSCTAQSRAQQDHAKNAQYPHAVQWPTPKLKPRG